MGCSTSNSSSSQVSSLSPPSLLLLLCCAYLTSKPVSLCYPCCSPSLPASPSLPEDCYPVLCSSPPPPFPVPCIPLPLSYHL